MKPVGCEANLHSLKHHCFRGPKEKLCMPGILSNAWTVDVRTQDGCHAQPAIVFANNQAFEAPPYFFHESDRGLKPSMSGAFLM